MRAERIMHQLGAQAFFNVYLLSLILHLPNCCKLHSGYYEIHIQQVQKKVCLNPIRDKTEDTMYCISTLNLKGKGFNPLLKLPNSTIVANEITQLLEFWVQICL